MKSNILKFILLFVCANSSNLYAQKAADVQDGNLWSNSVKVDGKIKDWATPLKATNKNTELSYSIANDQKNIYLAFQSSDMTIITKILAGGITLTINTEGKKKEKEGFILTYPIVTRSTRGGGQAVGQRTGGFQGGGGFQQMTSEQRDSMMMARVKTQISAAKEIKVFGFKTVTDSLISIYNEYGIKATANLGDDKVYICELAIPLDLMGLSIDKPKEFAYNVKLNGLQIRGFGGGGNRAGGGDGGGRTVALGGGGGGNRTGGIDFQELINPTDFWGKYTLATKGN